MQVASQSKDLRFAEPEPAAIFLLHSGCLIGPAPLSTLGVRAVKEQTSVGSSLFAQPLMLQAIPLDEPAILNEARTVSDTTKDGAPLNEARSKEADTTKDAVILSEARSAQSKDPDESRTATIAPNLSATATSPLTPTLSPELRATTLITALEQQASDLTDLATLSDHLSLLRRWYYRPEKQRAGEDFFPNINHEWPIRRILNASARAALGDPKPMADTNRDLAQRNSAEPELKPARTKVLHAGRPDVEREVPVVDKLPTFKIRRKSQPTEPR
jgi:hypothetical protein